MSESENVLARNAAREKRFVALTSVIAAIVMTGAKVVVGVATGSLGILSEAAHSGLDLLAAAMTLWAVRMSAQPADREHPYGHGKFENLSALFETLLLLATCVWIVYEAVERLFVRAASVDVNVWSFVVMVVCMAINWSRSRALTRVAKKYDSQALEADALHFSTDNWSSGVVIVGLSFVFLAKRLGVPWLEKADTIAALGVAAIVVWVSMKLGKKTIDALLDAVPGDLHQKVLDAARVSGVLDVRKVRMRKSGPEYFVELTLAVGRDVAFERAHDIAHEAETAVRQALPGSDVVVHVDPDSAEQEGLLSTIRRLAALHALGAHGIRAYEEGGRLFVELHLEVNDKLCVREAHDEVTRFEEALRKAAPEVARVITHIEPVVVTSKTASPLPDERAPVRAAVETALAQQRQDLVLGDLEVHRVAGELSVSFHCKLGAFISITDAHALTEQVEKSLRMQLPGLGRVVIHVEPQEEEAARPPQADSHGR